jgi:threonine dehydrogenase-like Zn-dependent dehydrogenase
MRAAITTAVGVMELADVPEPGSPGPGQVVVRPAAVGICGSDFHYFLGEIGEQAVYPRIQGHEVGAVVEAVGPDCVGAWRPATASLSTRSRTAGTAIRAGSGGPTSATTSA